MQMTNRHLKICNTEKEGNDKVINMNYQLFFKQIQITPPLFSNNLNLNLSKSPNSFYLRTLNLN